MVSLECRECGREEHFHSIEDATLAGWNYNYDWICPLCISGNDIDDVGDDSLLGG